MFFIKKGKVAGIINNHDQFKFMIIDEGFFFGELDLLFYREIRKYSIKAVTDCELLVLNKKKFIDIFFNEYRDIGMKFLESSYARKKKTQTYYKEAIKYCNNILLTQKISKKTRKKDFQIKIKDKVVILIKN